MRLMPVFCLSLLGPVLAGEQPANRPYPLWDGQESVADYAKHENLPSTKTLDLGNGVKLEMVLIPAGQFIMGTPEPVTPNKSVMLGQPIVVLGGALALILVAVVIVQSVRKRQRPKFSLRWLLLFVFSVSIAMYGGVRWHKAAWKEYDAAKMRFEEARPEEKPAHVVKLTTPFYMGKFLVTQEQYQQIVGFNPSPFVAKDNPVAFVSWDKVQEFCRSLETKLKISVRLPTEAEWEYSCRAGTRTRFYSGDNDEDVSRVAWCECNRNGSKHPNPVGQKDANIFGLYDMHGNLFQFCQDWYSEDYYSKSPPEDPQGPLQYPKGGDARVLRGGPWYCNLALCRSARRNGTSSWDGSDAIGFRVVMPVRETE